MEMQELIFALQKIYKTENLTKTSAELVRFSVVTTKELQAAMRFVGELQKYRDDIIMRRFRLPSNVLDVLGILANDTDDTFHNLIQSNIHLYPGVLRDFRKYLQSDDYLTKKRFEIL